MITESELKRIASAAIIRDRSHLVSGKKTPAASGTPSPLSLMPSPAMTARGLEQVLSGFVWLYLRGFPVGA